MSRQALIEHIQVRNGIRDVCISQDRLLSTDLPDGVTLKTIRAAERAGVVSLRRIIPHEPWWAMSLVSA